MTEPAAPAFRFVTGGTLPPDSPSYVRRAADDELLQACLEGRFAYVLSSRQMGKSSLLARTIEALRLQGVTVTTVDLTAIGTQGLTAETWYAGVLAEIERGCSPATELFDWWAGAALQSPVQRFVRYLGEVVLAEVSGPVVVVIDEIDSTLKLDFSDDFYAAIRHLHNARADQPALARLSFVLAGMATPTELIHDAARTPFNIGQRIEVSDFNAAQARQLVERIGLPEPEVDAVTAELLHWTGGQPYLTQRLCAMLAAEPRTGASGGSVVERVAEAVVAGLLSDSGRSDPHFQSVSRFMIASPVEMKEALFDTYARVLAGRSVACLDASTVHNRLRLSGIVKRQDEHLVPRNAVYSEIFGRAWLRRNRPTFWTPANRAWAGAMVLSLLVTGTFAWLWLRAEQATAQAQQARSEAVAGRQLAERATRQARQAAADALAANLSAAAAASLKAGEPDAALAQAGRALATRVTPVSLRAAFEAAEQHQSPAALVGHRDSVYQVAISPDSQHAVSASHDGSVRLWHLPDGEPQAELTGHTGAVVGLAYSADGRHIVSASHDRTARLWDGSTGKPLHTLQGHEDRLMAAVFSPDTSLVATASQDGTARLWRTSTGELQRTLHGHRHWVRVLAFSPDGRRLASAGNDGDVRLWDVRSARALARLTGHRDWVRSLAFSADGRRLVSASDDATARIWSGDTGRLQQVLRGHRISVRSAVFDATGERVATAGGDGTVRLWRSRDGREIGTWPAHRAWVNTVRFVGPDQLLSIGDDAAAVLQEIGRDRPLLTLRGHRQAITDLALDTTAQIALTASEDHHIRLWSLRPGSRLAQLRAGGKPVNDIAWSADGQRLLMAGEDGVALLQDPGGDKPPSQLGAPAAGISTAPRGKKPSAAPTSEITAVALSADGRYAAVASKAETATGLSGGPTVRLFDARSGLALPLPGPGHRATAHMVTFSRDGAWLLSAGDDDQALLWPTQGDAPPIALRGHQGAVHSAVFSPDGRHVLTASADGSARLWSMPDGRPSAVLEHGSDSQRLRMARFSADGRRVATAGDDHRVRLWDTDTGRLLRTLEGHDDIVMSARFSPDGRQLVSASQDRSARVWDVATGQMLFSLAAGRSDIARDALYSPDGTLIVTTSDDGHARLWHASDGAAVGNYLHTDWIWSAAFSPDGRRLATASEDGTAVVWDLTRSAADPTRLGAWIDRRLRHLGASAASAASPANAVNAVNAVNAGGSAGAASAVPRPAGS